MGEIKLILRIITGIVGIIIAAVIIQFGGLPFAVFAALLALIGWHEYSSAFSHAGISTAYIFGAMTVLLILCCAYFGNIEEVLAVMTLGMLAILLLTVFLGMSPVDAGVSIAGVFYIGLPFAHLILLRFLTEERNPFESLHDVQKIFADGVQNLDITQILSNLNFDTGCALIWILFTCTWASDTFAYFVGSAFGSHKLASSISPKKTVEGFLGSIFGTTLTGILIGHFLFGFSLIYMAGAGFLLAIVATLGDLVESVIKRFAGIKDSGFIIPGHGGVLDRFDSIFFTAPIFYYYIIIAGII